CRFAWSLARHPTSSSALGDQPAGSLAADSITELPPVDPQKIVAARAKRAHRTGTYTSVSWPVSSPQPARGARPADPIAIDPSHNPSHPMLIDFRLKPRAGA